MSRRLLRASAPLCCLVIAACGGDGSRILAVAGSANAATVRFVNATATPLDLAVNGSVPTTNANIAPGGGVACFTIDDPTVPGLAVRAAGTTTDLTGFAPLFSAGGRYTLVAFPGAGTVQFINVPIGSVALSGGSALRVFNGSSGLGTVDVYATTPSAALGTPNVSGVGFGSASAVFDVPAGTVQVRLTSPGTTNVVFDAGTQTFEAGKSYTLVISSATAAILVPDC